MHKTKNILVGHPVVSLNMNKKVTDTATETYFQLQG